jgi:hypothetical protein
MSIFEIHGRLGNTALLYTAVLAVWALWRYFRRQGMDSSYWGALAIAEVLLLVKGALGGYIYLSGIAHLERSFMHLLYGVVSLLVIPAVFAFTRGDDRRRVMLIYGVALLFLVGVILRAQMVA